MSEGLVNRLYYGDNLDILRGEKPGITPIVNESVDLIYLDPPFNSSRNYNLLFKQHKGQDSPAQIMAFEDTWTFHHSLYHEFMEDQRNSRLWKLMSSLIDILGESEMMAYVLMMAPRLLELHRKLKPTGSLYLHCDPVASHYLKIILDVIFSPQSFKNEITWKRTSAHSDAKNKFADVSDVILFYGASHDTNFYPVYLTHDPHYVGQFYRHDDHDGRGIYRLDNITSPNPRPNLMYEWMGFPWPQKGWRFSLDTMQRMHEEGRIHYPKRKDGSFDLTKRPQVKRYLKEQEGTLAPNIWTDIQPIQAVSKERRGYPTQKPLALLERILSASTREGDIVLDPFCGCGTAIVAAERMNRHWIGIDITYLAINEIVDRLNTEKVECKDLDYRLEGTPKDAHSARKLFETTSAQNHKPFEQWAITLVGGKWNDKKGADRGIDGRIFLRGLDGSYQDAVIQVKGGNALTLSSVRDFANVIESTKSVLGIMISMKEPTFEMKRVCEQMGYANWPSERKYPRYQILTIEDLVEKGKRAEVPDSYRIGPDKGVGRKQDTKQDSMDDLFTD